MREEESVAGAGDGYNSSRPSRPSRPSADEFARELVVELSARGLTLAVAESLTGGLLTAKLIDPPGASAVVLGGVIAYNTDLKHTLLGVDAAVLAVHGAVHPDVASHMAIGVRERCGVRGRAADIGVATTGAAGPDPQDGQPPGTVFIAVSSAQGTRVNALSLSGDRGTIRNTTVYESLVMLKRTLGESGNK